MDCLYIATWQVIMFINAALFMWYALFEFMKTPYTLIVKLLLGGMFSRVVSCTYSMK